MEVRGLWEISVSYSQFCYKPETALNKSLKRHIYFMLKVQYVCVCVCIYTYFEPFKEQKIGVAWLFLMSVKYFFMFHLQQVS